MLAVILIPATVAVLMLIAFQVGDSQSHNRSYNEGFDEGYHQAWLDASETDRNLAAGIEQQLADEIGNELSGGQMQIRDCKVEPSNGDLRISGGREIHDVVGDTAWSGP